jgi:hypothetical protein
MALIAKWRDVVRAVTSPEDLAGVVAAVRSTGEPTMVFLEAENGRVLVFGVGHRESVLTFYEPDGTSFHSLGDPDRRDRLRFRAGDLVDDFMGDMAVATTDALVAAAEFLETDERPEGITWEADQETSDGADAQVEAFLATPVPPSRTPEWAEWNRLAAALPIESAPLLIAALEHGDLIAQEGALLALRRLGYESFADGYDDDLVYKVRAPGDAAVQTIRPRILVSSYSTDD